MLPYIDGFNIQCETTSSAAKVNLVVLGKSPERE